MAKWRCVGLWLLLLQGLWWRGRCAQSRDGFNSSLFHGTRTTLLECAGRDVDNMHIMETTPNRTLVSLFTYRRHQCESFQALAACTFTPLFSVRVLITDLRPGETKRYQCLIRRRDRSGVVESHYFLNVTGAGSGTTQPTVVTSESGGSEIEEAGDPQHATVSHESGGFPSAVAYVLLVALIVVIGVCSVLVGRMLLNKRQKRKRAVDPDAISFQSEVTDRSFYYAAQGTMGRGAGRGTGGGGGRVEARGRLAPLSSPAPPGPPPYPPGGPRQVMDYQRPYNALPQSSSTLPRKDAPGMGERVVPSQDAWGTMPVPRAPAYSCSPLPRSASWEVGEGGDMEVSGPTGEGP